MSQGFEAEYRRSEAISTFGGEQQHQQRESHFKGVEFGKGVRRHLQMTNPTFSTTGGPEST